MTIAKADRKKVMPSKTEIRIVTDAINGALSNFTEYQQKMKRIDLNDDKIITTDHLPMYRRGMVNSAVLREVNKPGNNDMEAVLLRSSAFQYVLVKFRKSKINMLIAHLPIEKKLPVKSNIRGDHSSFNLSLLKHLGIEEEEYYPQYAFDFDSFNDGMVDIKIAENEMNLLENVHFGLMLFYDGKKPKVPYRIAALSPEQDRYLFTEYIVDEVGESPAEHMQPVIVTSDKVVEMPKPRKRPKLELVNDDEVSTVKEAGPKLKPSAIDRERNTNDQS